MQCCTVYVGLAKACGEIAPTIAVGQRMGIVPSVVTAEFSDGEGSLGEGQNIQGAGRECIALKFVIFSKKKSKTLNLNLLIFYANIVRASQAVFFPPGISSSFLSTFIAWLNLDLGIETCFYDGLDAYAKTWLQFVFPIYIWLMVIIIITASHYSTRVSRVIPNNALHAGACYFIFAFLCKDPQNCYHRLFLNGPCLSRWLQEEGLAL